MIGPKLRFPEFCGYWEKKPFGEICKIKSSKYNPETEKSSLKCVELEHLSQKTGQILGYCDSKEQNSIKNSFEKGNVLFGKLRPYLRKYWLAEFDGVCSSEIWVFDCKEMLNNFLFHLIQTNKFNYISNISSGSKMPRSDWKYISNVNFSIPSLPEQEKIASFLSKVDEKIGFLEKKLDLWKTYKKGIIQQILSQTLRFNDNNGEKFFDWEEKKLGDIATIIGGGTPDTLINEYWEGDINWYTPTEVGNDKYVYCSKRKISKIGLKNSSAKLLPSGTVLLSSRATIGEMSILKTDAATNQGFQSLIVKKEHHNEFIYYLGNKINKELLRKSSGSTFLEISKKEVAKIIVNIPSQPEQIKIANFLSDIDTKINNINTELKIIKKFKKGLLQKMFF